MMLLGKGPEEIPDFGVSYFSAGTITAISGFDLGQSVKKRSPLIVDGLRIGQISLIQ
jgi:hypothetical protein